MNAMLGRHVLQHDGELSVGPEPAAGQSCAGVENWEHYRRGLGKRGREKALGQQAQSPAAAGQSALLLHGRHKR